MERKERDFGLCPLIFVSLNNFYENGLLILLIRDYQEEVFRKQVQKYIKTAYSSLHIRIGDTQSTSHTITVQIFSLCCSVFFF